MTKKMEYNQQFKAIFDCSLDGLVLADAKTKKFYFANNSFCNMLGYSDEEIKGIGVIDIHPKEDLTYVIGQFEKQMRREIELARDIPVKRKDGSIFYADISSAPIMLGGVNYLLGSFRDVTDRKIALEKADKYKKELQTIIDSVPALIFYKDKENRFIRVNKFLADLTGLQKDKMEGRHLSEIYPSYVEKYWEDDKEVIKSGISKRDIIEPMETPDGIRWVKTDKIPYIDENRNILGIIGFSADITGQKKKQEELIRSNKDLEQFAYVAAHDLMEPLRAINSFGSILKSQYKNKLDEDGQEYIDLIKHASERMEQLIESLLNYSRLTNQNITYEETDLEEIVREVIKDLAWKINEEKAEIKIGILPTIKADSVQMCQLFQNLIQNAIKYRKKDEPPKVLINSTLINEGIVEITIEDNGIGFDEKYVEKIFQPFSRLHSREKYEGTGMGLAICEKVVYLHNGNITAKSTPGKGSTFIITLPKK